MRVEKKWNNHIKCSLFIAILLLIIIFLLAEIKPVFAQTAAQGGKAVTAEELNQALGGSHQVFGNTVTLQDDVVLDRTIRVEHGSEPLILNTDGKSITFGKAESDVMFHLIDSALTLTGQGSVTSTKEDSVLFLVQDNSSFTMNSGALRAEGGFPVEALSYKKGPRVKITINGGTIYGTNTGDCSLWESGKNIAIWNCDAQVDLRMNGGKTGAIHLSPPRYADIYNEHHFYGNNTLNIKGGTIASILHHGLITVSMHGGTIGQYFSAEKGIFRLYGGQIRGNGVDLHDGELLMKGGIIRAVDGEGLHVRNSDVSIYGGTIMTEKKGARGISIEGNSTVTLRGGTIKSAAAKSSSAGIYAFADKEYNYKPKVNFKAAKGATAYIKGYKYSIYKRGSANVSICKHTKISTPKAKKKSYISGQKLPKSVKGNLSVTYRK